MPRTERRRMPRTRLPCAERRGLPGAERCGLPCARMPRTERRRMSRAERRRMSRARVPGARRRRMSALGPTASGIGLRREHLASLPRELDARTGAVDFVEIVAEAFVRGGSGVRAALERVRAHVPVIAHGVSSSLGGPEPLDRAWLRELKAFLDVMEIPVFSEHVCWSSFGGAHSFELLPLPHTGEAGRWVGARARQLADALERPVWLENVTYYAEPAMHDPGLDGVDLVLIAAEESGASLVLDLANLWVNAENHGRCPHADLARLATRPIGMVHIAGSRFEPAWDVRVDDHASPVPDAVWALHREMLARAGPVPTLVEWDQNVPALERVLHERDRAAGQLRVIEMAA